MSGHEKWPESLYSPARRRQQDFSDRSPSSSPSSSSSSSSSSLPDVQPQLIISEELKMRLSRGFRFSVAEMICTAAQHTLLADVAGHAALQADRDIVTSRRKRKQSGAAGPAVSAMFKKSKPSYDFVSDCTEVGSAIAEGMVRNAATRIFFDENQSIMELISNAVDASVPAGDGTVGKFGFGVFSNFAWLYRDDMQGSEVIVITRTKEETTEVRLATESDVNDKSGKRLFCQVLTEPNAQTAPTGTKFSVRLSSSDPGRFSPSILRAFADRFRFVGNCVRIFFTTFGGNSFLINRAAQEKNESIPRIDVRVHSTFLEVEDYGTGMSLDTVFRYFLVPSISSKSVSPDKVAAQLCTPTVTLRPANNQANFIVAVAGVAVIDLVVPSRTGGELIVRFANSMPVTLARDDILMNFNHAHTISTAILEAVRAMLVDRGLEPWEKNIQLVSDALKAYASHSPGQHAGLLRDLVDAGIHEILKSGRLYVVGTDTVPFLRRNVELYGAASMEADRFIVYDQASPLAGERMLCERVASSMVQRGVQAQVDVFSGGNVLALRYRGHQGELEKFGRAIVVLPDIEITRQAGRDQLLTLLKQFLPDRVFMNETQTAQDRDITRTVLPRLRIWAPRFQIEQDAQQYPQTQLLFDACVNFMAQVLGFDNMEGLGTLKKLLLAQQGPGYDGTGLLGYLDCGLTTLCSAYMQWPSCSTDEAFEPLLDNDRDFFDRALGACNLALSRRSRLLNPWTYGGRKKLVWSEAMLRSGKHDLPNMSTDVWANSAVIVQTCIEHLPVRDIIYLATPKDMVRMGATVPQRGADASAARYEYSIDEVLRVHMGLRGGTDFTARYFRHMVDLLAEGALYRRTSPRAGRLQHVNMFSLAQLPLECLFIRLARIATLEQTGVRLHGTARARTFYHILSMGARSASEFVVTLVAAIAALCGGRLKSCSPEYLVELAQAMLEVSHTAFTAEEYGTELWDSRSNIWEHEPDDVRRDSVIDAYELSMPIMKVNNAGSVLCKLAVAFQSLVDLRERHHSTFPLYRMPVVPEQGARDVCARFSLSALISQLFVVPFVGLDTLQKTSVCSLPDLPFNIASIAINEGTSKDVLTAVITELAQNSIDAIRTAGTMMAHNLGVNIRIGYHVPAAASSDELSVENHFDVSTRRARGSGASTATSKTAASKSKGARDMHFTTAGIVVEVDDAVGIPTGAFPALMVPYLSSKDPRKGDATGEMGNGLFNVYREAQLVVMQTRSDAATNPEDQKTGMVRIFDIPTRDQTSGRVTALEKVIQRLPDNGRAGTSITMYMPPERASYTSRLVQLQTYVQEKFSSFSGSPIYLNGTLLNHDESTFQSSPVTSKCVDVHFLRNLEASSQVTTNGIPFKSVVDMAANLGLGQWQTNILRRGVTIDLKRPVICYRPVQSRSRLSLTDDGLADLGRTITHACYVRLVLEAYQVRQTQGSKSTQLDTFMENVSAVQDYRQILPKQEFGDAEYKNYNFAYAPYPRIALFTYYRPTPQSLTMLGLLNKCLKYAPTLPTIEDLDPLDYETKLYEMLTDSRNQCEHIPFLERERLSIAVTWVLNKINSVVAMAAEKDKVIVVDRTVDTKTPDIPVSERVFKQIKNNVWQVKAVRYAEFPDWEYVDTAVRKVYCKRLRGLVKPFLDLYTEVCVATKDLGFTSTFKLTLQVTADPFRGNPGWYMVVGQILTVNLCAFSRRDIDAFDAQLRDANCSVAEILDMVHQDKRAFAAALFGHEGLLCHEMEHARRGQQHEHNSPSTHGIVNYRGHARDYGECMGLTYELVVQKAAMLIERWVMTFRKK